MSTLHQQVAKEFDKWLDSLDKDVCEEHHLPVPCQECEINWKDQQADWIISER